MRVLESIVMKPGSEGSETALGNCGGAFNGHREGREQDQQRTHDGISHSGVVNADQTYVMVDALRLQVFCFSGCNSNR